MIHNIIKKNPEHYLFSFHHLLHVLQFFLQLPLLFSGQSWPCTVDKEMKKKDTA